MCPANSAIGATLRCHHRRRRHCRLSAALTAFALLFFASASASAAALQLGAVGEVGVVLGGSEVGVNRRRLGGPGSAPPSCRSKCGKCWPCKAVHVPIQPGQTFPLEYYPEAWRCKCGNKLFMP